MNAGTVKTFRYYSGEIALHDLVVAHIPPLELTAALVLDIQDIDDPSAVLALTPVSLAALQTICDHGLESFINEVNLVDYPVFHTPMSDVILLDTDEKLLRAVTQLSEHESQIAGVIQSTVDAFRSLKEFNL